MDEMAERGDAFAIPDLWRTSSLAHFDEKYTTDPIDLRLELLDLQGNHDDVSELTQKFDAHPPYPSGLTYGSIEDLGALDTFSVSSSAESIEVPEALEDDIWAFPNSDSKAQTFVEFKSWEKFYDKSFQEPRTVYFSEGGSPAFDAALAAQAKYTADGEKNRISGRLVQPFLLLKSLLWLGLGRESVLYRLSEESRSFYPLIKDVRTSGYSLEACQSLSSTFIDYGNRTIQLQNFIQKIQALNSSPASLIALASSLSDVLARLHSQLGDPSTPVRSLLQLQSRFERPGLMLYSLRDIVAKVQDAVTDEEILSRLYGFIQDTENTASWLRPTMLRLLTAASKPWCTLSFRSPILPSDLLISRKTCLRTMYFLKLSHESNFCLDEERLTLKHSVDSVSGWLGLTTNSSVKHQHQYQLPGFVKIIEESRKVEDKREKKNPGYDFEPFSLPSFITVEDAKVVFETGKSLRLLEAHQPEHPLLEPFATKGIKTPDLAWQFSWEDIHRIQTQAQEYERTLQIVIEDFDLQGTKETSRQLKREGRKQSGTEANKCLSEEAARAYISASISAIERPFPELSATEGEMLSDLSLLDINDVPKETCAPPMSLISILSFNPLVSTRAHLTNRACLRLLFKHHDLRSHFTLLHRYSLFGDGVFASRLSHSLFDPDIQTTERRKGHSRAGTSGLKLGSRDTWPPASSELRLALMGILTDTYYQLDGGSSMFRNELPGGLSFSIRDMPEEELQRCMNPDSIEALDFLKLEYKPPSPLDAVITSTSLLKYDAVFKLLLRAARMLFAVNQLFKDTKSRPMAHRRSVDPLTQIFSIESHHFISAICAYFFDGVQANWAKLLERLEDVEKSLDRDGSDNLPNLRDFHEGVLDRMMFALILRKRQSQVMILLEEIFSLVLQFARHTRLRSVGFREIEEPASSAELSPIYKKFKKKVRVFVSVCRGLRERRGQGGTSAQNTPYDFPRNGETDEDGGNTIGQLLLKLEMSGYYSK